MKPILNLLLFFMLITMFSNTSAVPIETPDVEECNEFAIQAPSNWGYRTFKGHNGLIGVLWPSKTSFNMTDTAVFVFLQKTDEEIPEELDNINLFTEKCPQAEFILATPDEEKDPTMSLAELYFKGRCGRTTILFKEVIKQYTLVIAFISARYASKQEFADTKNIVESYKIEISKALGLKPDDNNEDSKEKTEKSQSAESDEE